MKNVFNCLYSPTQFGQMDLALISPSDYTVKTCKHAIMEFGQNFHCKWGVLSYLNPEDDIKLRTYNYFCKIDPDTLEILSSHEIDFPHIFHL